MVVAAVEVGWGLVAVAAAAAAEVEAVFCYLEVLLRGRAYYTNRYYNVGYYNDG